ncbi:MAG: lactonase family protein [Parasporobacterium sp.]|nr:lactonase family protein [Parasporobacterium sp.]
MSDKYMAYVGSYTNYGKSKGIAIFDVDVEKGTFYYRKEIAVNNSSYLTISYDHKFLYTLVDEGVSAFRILPDGDLEFINTVGIRGMRGCYITADIQNRYLVIAGYHDGKMTVMNLQPDGSIGTIASEIFNRGYGSVAERNFRPHVTCCQFTPDMNFILMVDMGIDNVKVYKLDREDGHLTLADIIHCELNSAPRYLLFSDDGKHMYMVSQLKNYITVYNYMPDPELPRFQFKQLVSTLPKKSDAVNAAVALRFSHDFKYIFCTNAGENSVAMYERNLEDGLLYNKFILPVSGDYPKDVELFPDNRHLVSINHDSGTLTFFTVNYEKNNMVMCSLPVKVDNPNVCKIMKLND